MNKETLKTPIVTFTLREHPNADSLSIAETDGGVQVVVKTEEFVNESWAVHLPPDSISAIENHPLIGFLEGKKVKSCKLRGVISDGLLIPWSKVQEFFSNALGMSEDSMSKWQVGVDVKGPLKVKRWQSQSFYTRPGNCVPENGNFIKYNKVFHYRDYTKVLPFNTPVQITEKLDGTSFRASLIENQYCLGSRNRQLDPTDTKSPYAFCYVKDNIKAKLDQLKEIYKNDHVGIYGEIVSKAIQDHRMSYNALEPTLYVYDVMVDKKFLPPVEAKQVAEELGLVYVPVLKIGSFKKEDLELRNGKSKLADHIREGIVIKPLVPAWDEKLGRVILKVISEEFKAGNFADYTDN